MKSDTKENLSVLLVDDDVACLQYLGVVLKLNGINVTGATSAEQGLQALRSQCFDLVMTDMNLPCMDGPEFIRELRKNFDGVPVILITGDGDKVTAAELREMGAQLCLSKPLDDGNALAERIREMVEVNGASDGTAAGRTVRPRQEEQRRN